MANIREVQNFPVGLFVSKLKLSGTDFEISEEDQSHYDQAVTVRQSDADPSLANDIVTVGGSLQSNGGWDAALFDLTITSAGPALTTDFDAANQVDAAKDGTYIGAGIHPDVHIVSNVDSGSAQWIGCDGGVFRRFNDVNRSMNAGLASAEPGIIDSHPALDGPVLAGTQDNGAIQRIGDTLWQLQRKGDGGGCLFHPTKPYQRIMQYIRTTWHFKPSTISPPGPANRTKSEPDTPAERDESKRAQFYSKPATARTNTDNARLFIGTDRIWYSANWDGPPPASAASTPPPALMSWVTIPSHTDPHPHLNTAQDQLQVSGIADRVNVIRVINDGDATKKFDGMSIFVLCAWTVRIFRYSHPDQSATKGTWTPIDDSIISNASDVDRPKTKKNDDDVPNPFVPYLPRKRNSAWTDIAVHQNTNGRETCYVTTTGQVTVASDGTLSGDEHYDTCWWYDGAGKWYPTGLRNAPLDAGNGTGGSAVAAHSVIVDPDNANVVYVGNRIGVWRGEIDTTDTHPGWTWKPAMEGLPQSLVEDLSIFKSADTRFLRAALVSRGVWERDISARPVSVGRTFIRSLPYDTGRVELPAAPVDALTNAPLNYHSSPDIIPLSVGSATWGPGLPNEADLHAATVPDSFSKALHEVYVMVHHRHTTAVDGADIDINVFLQKDAPVGNISDFAITAAWRTAILGIIRGNSPALPAGLLHLGIFHPASPVDARTPRAVRMPLDLTFDGSNDSVMLIAIVTSADNLLLTTDLAPGNLNDIVRKSQHIAVRKINRTT